MAVLLDEKSVRSYMAGEYEIIGRIPDSTATYTGHITLRDENGVIQVTRTIEGCSIRHRSRHRSYSRVKNAVSFDGKKYDATYRWQSDPDNYPRFTDYLYLSGTKSPGLEALFPIHE